jgi:uncharacterized membrane protein
MRGARRPERDELPLGRLEAFSDGVFAIAITLLVLELGVSASASDDMLGAILAQWPSYLAYITSFLTIGAIWLEHSTVTSVLRVGDAALYRINLLVLLLVGFLPFPTKLTGEYFGERQPEQVAVVFLGLTMLVLDLAVTAFARYAIAGRRLVREDVDDERLRGLARAPSIAFYAVSLPIGFLIPTVGVALYLGIAIYLVVPTQTLRGLLGR